MWDKDYLSLLNSIYNKNEKVTLDSQQLTTHNSENIVNQELYHKAILQEILISKEIQSKIYDFGERIAKLESNISYINKSIEENKESKRFSITTFIAIVSLILTVLLTINAFYPLSDKLFNNDSQKIAADNKK